MRFSTLFILVCMGVSIATACHWYSGSRVPWRYHHQQWQLDRPTELTSEWGERFAQHEGPANAAPPFRPDGEDVQVWDGTETHPTDFAWSHFAVALVLLTGGTLVCRRIFMGSGSCRQSAMRSSSRPLAASNLSAEPSIPVVSRMCPRPDCGGMNPSMAHYCRRCGSRLRDA